MTFDESIKLASTVLGFINFVVTVGLWLYVRNSDRHEKIDKRFAEMEANVDERLDKTGERLARLEERVERSPTHDDVGRVYERINALAASLSEIKGAVDSVNGNVRQLMARVIEKGLK